MKVQKENRPVLSSVTNGHHKSLKRAKKQVFSDKNQPRRVGFSFIGGAGGI
jgi:hypothetical protein